MFPRFSETMRFASGDGRKVVLVLVGAIAIFVWYHYGHSGRKWPKQQRTGSVPQLRTGVQPSAAAVSGAVLDDRCALTAGSRWYRHGRPFHEINVRDVTFAFKAARLSGTVLLLYAQLLGGIFQPRKEQYVAVLMNSRMVVANVRYHKPDVEFGEMKTAHSEQQLQPGVWYVVCLSTYPNLLISVVRFHRQRTAAGEDQIMSQCSSQFTAAPHYKYKSEGTPLNLTLDSGLYFGGTIDVSHSTELRRIKDLTIMHGKIYCCVRVNMARVDLRRSVQGSPAEVWRREVSRIDLRLPIQVEPRRQEAALDDMTFRQFPVVSAASEDHAREVLDLVSSVNTRMRHRGIIVYDLGLHTTSRGYVEAMCNTAMRSIRRDFFADLLDNLQEYQWKPLVIYAAFLEFDGVIWADASIRFRKPIREVALVKHGVGFVGVEEPPASPVGAFTHDATLAALGVQRQSVAKARMAVSGATIWMRQGNVPVLLLHRWMACAFRKDCIAPTGAKRNIKFCRLRERTSGHYIGCHRYDQSVLSILLSKVFPGRNATQCLVMVYTLLEIKRYPTEKFQRCFRHH
eukprot:scpid62037/ scgid29831/ 